MEVILLTLTVRALFSVSLVVDFGTCERLFVHDIDASTPVFSEEVSVSQTSHDTHSGFTLALAAEGIDKVLISTAEIHCDVVRRVAGCVLLLFLCACRKDKHHCYYCGYSFFHDFHVIC